MNRGSSPGMLHRTTVYFFEYVLAFSRYKISKTMESGFPLRVMTLKPGGMSLKSGPSISRTSRHFVFLQFFPGDGFPCFLLPWTSPFSRPQSAGATGSVFEPSIWLILSTTLRMSASIAVPEVGSLPTTWSIISVMVSELAPK